MILTGSFRQLKVNTFGVSNSIESTTGLPKKMTSRIGEQNSWTVLNLPHGNSGHEQNLAGIGPEHPGNGEIGRAIPDREGI